MPLRLAPLASRAAIRIGGPEATDFLQGLLSNDVERLEPGEARFAALASPQGKLLFDFILIKEDEASFLIDGEAARAEELIRKLKLYRLRAKVTIEASSAGVFAAFDRDASRSDGSSDLSNWIEDPRSAGLGYRYYGPLGVNTGAQASEHDYAEHRLSLGVPEGAGEFGIEKLFLLEANLEELHGVDFKKGCYIGQELTSRMKRKTELKKRLLPFHVERLPEPGASLAAGEREIGTVIGGALNTTFVLVRLDRLAEANGADLKIGDASARLRIPSYLRDAVAV